MGPCQAGAHAVVLVWRVKANLLNLDVDAHPVEGSCLMRISDSADRGRRHGQRVRAVDYHLDDGGRGAAKHYRGW